MTENLNNQVKSDLTFFEKVKNVLSYIREHFIKFPGFIITHPIRGFDDFKREGKGKMRVALTFLVLLILAQVLSFQYSGFIVEQRDPNSLNTLNEISLVVFPIVLFTVANWSVTTLFDGKGKMKEIFMMFCYSLYPLIWAKFVGILFSNVISIDEVGFYNLLIGLGGFLTGYMIFFGLLSIHEFGVVKSLLAILGTILSLLIILFVILLAFDLYQQVYSFIYTIYREISLRYL